MRSATAKVDGNGANWAAAGSCSATAAWKGAREDEHPAPASATTMVQATARLAAAKSGWSVTRGLARKRGARRDPVHAKVRMPFLLVVACAVHDGGAKTQWRVSPRGGALDGARVIATGAAPAVCGESMA
ncbi:MAG: hypothetical protein AAF628_36440 [Planctomycetota bacterium]